MNQTVRSLVGWRRGWMPPVGLELSEVGGFLYLTGLNALAVPEPATLAMLGASAVIGGSAAWRRRMRRRAA